MNDGLQHAECAQALGAYALGALPEAEAEQVRRHLAGCSECRGELEGLQAAVDVLPASVAQIEPPPELKARVMEVVNAEAEPLRASGASADRPPSTGLRRRWRWLPSPALRPALALGSVCLAAVVVAIVLITSGGTATRTIEAQITSPLLAGRVHAALQVRGTRAQLIVSGLPAPAADHVYELWVQHGSAMPQPAGTFVVQSGSVQVARPVKNGDVVLATLEPGTGTSAPTSTPFMMAKV